MISCGPKLSKKCFNNGAFLVSLLTVKIPLFLITA